MEKHHQYMSIRPAKLEKLSQLVVFAEPFFMNLHSEFDDGANLSTFRAVVKADPRSLRRFVG